MYCGLMVGTIVELEFESFGSVIAFDLNEQCGGMIKTHTLQLDSSCLSSQCSVYVEMFTSKNEFANKCWIDG